MSLTSHRLVRRDTRGMTLIEIMIVTAIIGIVATGAVFGFNALNRTRLRSTCMTITAASRFAYQRAIAKGKTVRVVFVPTESGEATTMAIEEAHGRITLTRSDDDEEAGVAVDPWQAAKQRLEDGVDLSGSDSGFSPIADEDGEAIEQYKPRELDAIVAKMFMEHLPDPSTDGSGAIYFFPNGQTQHTVIHITDEEAEDFYSLEVHPLTGRTVIRKGEYEPPSYGDELDEVEDRG